MGIPAQDREFPGPMPLQGCLYSQCSLRRGEEGVFCTLIFSLEINSSYRCFHMPTFRIDLNYRKRLCLGSFRTSSRNWGIPAPGQGILWSIDSLKGSGWGKLDEQRGENDNASSTPVIKRTPTLTSGHSTKCPCAANGQIPVVSPSKEPDQVR
ncbi:hypothetical protein AVEN_156509-1 [Araneus ventricosus]|uniref:Uncharacterized protein n=1 Tax=Araneus ventricosus TaxID=182803 RepID=A0A4Y2VEV0_ARAVE|nr:hypothetical protein AVEN_156509-1 [Araneus ventricosus]